MLRAPGWLSVLCWGGQQHTWGQPALLDTAPGLGWTLFCSCSLQPNSAGTEWSVGDACVLGVQKPVLRRALASVQGVSCLMSLTFGSMILHPGILTFGSVMIQPGILAFGSVMIHPGTLIHYDPHH